MTKESKAMQSLNYHTGCFSEFDGNDRVCKSLCALRLRCAVERERTLRLEVLEELVSVEQMLTKIQ